MNNGKVVICPKCIENYKSVPYTTPFQFRGLCLNHKIPENYICPICKSELVITEVTMDEMKILFAVSYDNSFLQAMIQLKENDIIEYNLKLSQFRTQVEQRKREMEQANQQSVPHCPNCNSTNIRPISGLNRGASIAMFGIFSKKINKSFECLNCKYTW